MREFSIGFDDLLNFPLKRFWFLVNQVDRLRAEQEVRQLQLLGSAQDGDALKLAYDNLIAEMGKVFVWEEEPVTKEIRINPKTGLDPEFDKEGLRSLKVLSTFREGQVI